MRTIINYIRSCFCKHDWEHLGRIAKYSSGSPCAVPYAYVDRWRCKKCGYIMKSEI